MMNQYENPVEADKTERKHVPIGRDAMRALQAAGIAIPDLLFDMTIEIPMQEAPQVIFRCYCSSELLAALGGTRRVSDERMKELKSQ